MGIETLLAEAQLPSDAAIERAAEKVAALQGLRHYRERLAGIESFYTAERARLESQIAAHARRYQSLCAAPSEGISAPAAAVAL